ncbi:hypothetical protein SEUCBS139899_000077 [Sporothrix eucalyptigena]|uniref:Uncharacterized protein n=1 Tax=Sporothrix eucalyptigena TaxID=1812306 RepID=A0ABP0ARG3_9PEZI
MNAPVLRGLRAATMHRSVAQSTFSPASRMAFALQQRSYSSLPTIAQSSFWKSLIPKPLRRNKDGSLPVANAVSSARKAKEWNPATFYIFIFLFIGSMSIQMIALKKDFDTFMRQSDVKIGLLREVIERVQKGEKVDVERVLGTGDPAKEAEWDSVIKELESDEVTKSFRRQEKKAAEAAAAKAAPATPATTPTVPETTQQPASTNSSSPKVASVSSFY